MSKGDPTAAYDQSMSSSSRMVKKICAGRGDPQGRKQQTQRRRLQASTWERHPYATKRSVVVEQGKMYYYKTRHMRIERFH